jgi:uracil-DNA glycosylase
MIDKPEIEQLLTQIRSCTECEADLPCGPRPIVAASSTARVLIIGQAPGIRVHESGVPWNDPSGDRLREWMGVSKEGFYNESNIALVPMGFCYPGTGDSGDLPPRPECAELWHEPLLNHLGSVRLTLVIGQYAQRYRLGADRKSSLTKTVEAWKEFTPTHLPLPHPSPRNNRWLKKNPWFESEVVPYLRQRVRRLVSTRINLP